MRCKGDTLDELDDPPEPGDFGETTTEPAHLKRDLIFVEVAQTMRDREAPWRERAACRGGNTHLFFPERRRGRRSTTGAYNTSSDTAEGRALCAVCPVTQECGQYAEDGRETGMWAGEWHWGRFQQSNRTKAEKTA